MAVYQLHHPRRFLNTPVARLVLKLSVAMLIRSDASKWCDAMDFGTCDSSSNPSPYVRLVICHGDHWQQMRRSGLAWHNLLAWCFDQRLDLLSTPCVCTLLPLQVVSRMRQLGFHTPSPIQAQSWPIVLEGSDLIAVAKTGSGKTLGYLLPVFHQIKRRPANRAVDHLPLALVLAPTRELAVQIHSVAADFGDVMDIDSCCLSGGVPKSAQVRQK